MAVIVEDYLRDGHLAFKSRGKAEEWLRENRGVIAFVPSRDAVECWTMNGDRPVAKILPMEAPE
jgi:hypothetical protein